MSKATLTTSVVQTNDIRLATMADVHDVGRMVYALILEIYPTIGGQRCEAEYILKAQAALAHNESYWAFLYFMNATPVGMISLNQCCATYAGGHFGEIAELYIQPRQRSLGIGKHLIDHASQFGRNKGWRFIEVGAPPSSNWIRTIEFYKRYGFEELGPRLNIDL
jgi:ribosomal protein S18 acetylase RimI-like enzyme